MEIRSYICWWPMRFEMASAELRTPSAKAALASVTKSNPARVVGKNI